MRQENDDPVAPITSTSPPAAADGVPLATAVATPVAVADDRPYLRNNFDGLRLIAALLVAYGHQTIDQTGTAGLRLVMFFSISGFLVAGSWIRDPYPPRFLARRFLRIWPGYATVIVCCAALSWIFPAPDMPEISRLGSVFYLTNLWFHGFDWGFFPFRNPTMNRSIWMIPFEVDMYLGFAVIALLGRRARIVAASILLLCALRAQQTTFAVAGLLDCWSLYFGGFFSFGILLREVPRLREGAIVGACVAGGVAALWLGERTAGLLLVIPPAAVWIGQQSWPGLRSAARFGDLSLGIFLWSFPVQQVTHLWLDANAPIALQLGIVLVQAIAIAWLSCHLIEQPALRLKPKGPVAYFPERRRAKRTPLAPRAPRSNAFLGRVFRWGG